MQTEADGFPPEDGYLPDLTSVLATVGPDRTAELEAQMVMFRDRASAAEATVMRLELDLARKSGELVIADDALRTVEADLDQAARLVPDPDEVTVLRQDLRDILTVVALHAPPDFRPSALMDRLVAAAGVQ